MSEIPNPPPVDPGTPAVPGVTGAPPSAPAVPNVPEPWADYVSKAPDPNKLEPYKNAKSATEAFELAQQRLADAQTQLRTRGPGLPPRPAADAPPEVHSAWRAAHGIPETPEGYGLTRPESVPEAVWNAEDARAFEKWAHAEGLSPELVKKLQGFDVERMQRMAGTIQQQEAAKAEQMRVSEAAELGKRFGDKLDSQLSDLQSVAQASGRDPGIFNPASDKFWGVEAVSFFGDMLKRIPRGEDGTMRNIGAPSASGAYDKTWAKAALNPSHPDYAALNNPRDPRHAELTRLRHEAYALG